MLDIRLIREQPEAIIAKLSTRGSGIPAKEIIEQLLACDNHRRACETEAQAAQAERNKISKSIGQARAKGEDTSAIEAEVRKLGDRITELNHEVAQAHEKQQKLLFELPNVPLESVPVGKSAEDNPVVRVWGEESKMDFAPLDHVQLGEKLGLFDLERATKLSGSGFICFTGKGAKLQRALINFCLDLHATQHGYTEVSPPFVVKRECMVGTGQLPKFEDDAYGLENGNMFLIPTAEVPVTNLYREEILHADQLPKKLVAYTPCFRREAGSAGKDTRGIIRVHQFDKVELVKVTTPEESAQELETLVENAERVLQLLGLHYRVVSLCTGDLGFQSAKTYDIEVWAPAQGKYLEVSSCSCFEEYQARRMNLRFKDAETGKNRFCHTINGSGTAMPRLFVALLETYQQADGSILIPETLRPYVGMDRLTAD